MRIGAVSKHSPDLARPGASGFKHQVAAIWRPRGVLVSSSVVGELYNAAGRYFNDVDIPVPGFPDAPGKGHEEPVGRP